MPVIQAPFRKLVPLVSLVGRAAGRVGEDVGLGVLVGPELLLARPQQLGCLHHVLHILVLIEAIPQQHGEVAVLVTVDTPGLQVPQGLLVQPQHLLLVRQEPF